ncbi:MAG: glycosyltransferase family 2 protein [Caldilineales bacterium]|nr:glycosyltransferase family 2 protein [Caldilineales bacterium]MCW5860726.1 glycosyltransferase family 2 protein [Caldilineales bacterium]
MHLGIVIVSYNVRDLLRACLASVFADLSRSPHLSAEVLVIDNASADDSAGMVAAAFPQAGIIASERNLGFAGGNNLGLRRLGLGRETQPPGAPDAILLLNPDTEVQPGALAAMAGFLASEPRAGGCGARLSYGDGSFQHSAFRFPGLAQLYLDLFPAHPRLLDSRLNGRFPRRLYEGENPFPVDFVLGAALMVRGQAIAAAGLLDEGFFIYAEEMDWQFRLRAAGWPIFCVPAAHITHHEGRSTRQFRGPMTVALWRSRLRYYDKHYPPWKRAAARRLIRRGMAAQSRAAAAAHQSGQIDDAELQARLSAYRQVIALLSADARP